MEARPDIRVGERVDDADRRLVGTTRRNPKPDSDSRLANSLLVLSRAVPDMAITCASTM
jgi:hypothetical protein